MRTFNDMRDLYQATLDKFEGIDDDVATIGELDTLYGGCAIGCHLEKADRRRLNGNTHGALRLLGVDSQDDDINLLIGQHDIGPTVGHFKQFLRRWLAAHPYAVEFPIVVWQPLAMEVPHG